MQNFKTIVKTPLTRELKYLAVCLIWLSFKIFIFTILNFCIPKSFKISNKILLNLEKLHQQSDQYKLEPFVEASLDWYKFKLYYNFMFSIIVTMIFFDYASIFCHLPEHVELKFDIIVRYLMYNSYYPVSLEHGFLIVDIVLFSLFSLFFFNVLKYLIRFVSIDCYLKIKRWL